jgi:hypothetical protein
MRNSVLEIEVDTRHNRNLYFVPIDRVVRGRFDWRRVADRNGAELREKWGEEPVPGQRIVLDAERREGAIVEPLYTRPELKKRIEAREQVLPPERQSYSNVDVAEWLYWLRAAVAAGDAAVVQGKLPEALDYRPKRFGERRSPQQRLTEALVAVLYAGLSDKQRKEVSHLLEG